MLTTNSELRSLTHFFYFITFMEDTDNENIQREEIIRSSLKTKLKLKIEIKIVIKKLYRN